MTAGTDATADLTVQARPTVHTRHTAGRPMVT